MVSRIIHLDLPVADYVAGFDTTIDVDHDGNTTFAMSSSLAALAMGRSFRTSISTHAIAHEHSVCGWDIESRDWTWKTSLAPHRVCQVASNSTGNLIAATLDNGTLSILRGTDGTVLATRRVAPEGTRLAASVEFVPRHYDVTTSSQPLADTLIILPPEDGPPILVSNMHGERLNNVENTGIVAEAARSMGLHALLLPDCDDIRAMRGVSISDNVIRLAVVDGDGRLAVFDYLLKAKTPLLVHRDVKLSHGPEEKNWEIDLEVGLRVQGVPIAQCGVASFLLFSLYMGRHTKLCWFNLHDLKVVCDFDIPSPLTNSVSTKRARILAMEPVQSCSPREALAIVLGVKLPNETSHQMETRIVQAVVKEVMDEVVVEQLHSIYTVPVPPSVQSMSIARTAGDVPYSFLCKSWSGDRHDCHLFTTPHSAGVSVGSIRLLCAQGDFQEAQDLLIHSPDACLVQDPFAGFHSSEITVKRLMRLLDMGSLSSPESVALSQKCVKQLLEGAITGNSLAKTAFVGVVDRIIQWPDDKAFQNPPHLQEVTVVLEGMMGAMSKAALVFEHGSSSKSFFNKIQVLKERLLVIKYLQEMSRLAGESPSGTRMSKIFKDVQTFKDLFATLVQNACFDDAEKLSRSHFRARLSTESMASSILSISSVVNPKQYYNLLVDVIFPSLSIGHEMLPGILAWSCSMADAFDEYERDHENTLDDAIFLLECMERATKDLRLRLHSSFATYTPFVETAPKRRKHSRTHMTTSVASMDISLASIESELGSSSGAMESQLNPRPQESEVQRPNPTILEMSRLKGGARKTRLDGSLNADNAVDEHEDIVELKLASARCLKYARTLGMDSREVTLGNFATCGGAQNIAKGLVQKFSKKSISHAQRLYNLRDIVRPFCASTMADFDEALFSYVRDLCGGKVATSSKIEEAASIARCCTSNGAKCQITLVTLRAALFCRFSPKWLSELSQEAIDWAVGDSSLRSELEEASRLLLIDGIVGRYCGEGAKELFHVDNPRHAMRLLQFVARHFHQDVALNDSMDLCDAFAHLSREDACSHLLENAILHGGDDTASRRLATLYAQNVMLAKATYSRVIQFCIDLIEEAATDGCVDASTNERFVQLVQCGQGLTTVALSNVHTRADTESSGFSGVYYDEQALENLLLDFKRISSLQKAHSVCLTISSLRQPKSLVQTIVTLLKPVTDAYLAGDSASCGIVVTRIKRACSILSGCSHLRSSDLWYAAVGSSACRLAMKCKNTECLKFMSDLGLFEVSQNALATRTCLAVSLSFCLKASKLACVPDMERPGMKHVTMALSLLRDHAVRKCPLGLVDRSVSLTELCEAVSQIFHRSDEGIGEELDVFQRSLNGMKPKRGTELTAQAGIHRPILHPTWYVGDGLLLPPFETLRNALQYFRQTLQTPTQSDAALNLHTFVCSRGAFGLGLRLLVVASVARMSSGEEAPSYSSFHEAGKRNVVALAERYVGGTSNGFTSGGVDSEMAVALLLCLPLKMAFGIYRSTLPTAISTRDFSRVITLANVGVASGTGKLFPDNDQLLEHWARQQNFVLQCRELSLRAKWWKILQEFSVPFDTQRFQDTIQSSRENTKVAGHYVKSLLPPFIHNLSRKFSNSNQILETILDFSEAFGLPRHVPVQQYVEFLFSVPQSDHASLAKDHDDIRLKLSCLDDTVKSLLRHLDSNTDRAFILRSCIRRLEEPATSSEYERLSVALSLYHTELSDTLSNDESDDARNGQRMELELIDRRRDALAILSWFFQSNMYEERPPFSGLFLPLPESWDADYSEVTQPMFANVLGTESLDGQKNAVFDPLHALDPILRSSKGIAAASALAPLCLPLGVPRGYIHARCLISRFKKSAETGVSLPSFEVDVLPTLNRLQVNEDIADMADWCAVRYAYDSEDKLRCLDHALSFALKASTETEARCARGVGSEAVPGQMVSRALDRVKRITGIKDRLADRLSVNTILRTAISGMGIQNGLGHMVTTLISTLDEKFWAEECEFIPERFVEAVVEEASKIASEGCLSRAKAISLGHVRAFSKVVSRSTIALADKYSHIQVHGIAHRLVQRWLLHGDGSAFDVAKPLDFNISNVILEKMNEKILPDIDEDDTMNFVMDLNSLEPSNDFSTPSAVQEAKLTSEEEPKFFSEKGSDRELHDTASRRVSLRIAFTMAFASEDCFSGSTDPDTENEEPPKSAKVKSSRLRSKLSSQGTKQPSDVVVDNCRELLRIVFARSAGSGSLVVRDLNTSLGSRSSVGLQSKNAKQTITFAMRHRALRVASILCPQNVLDDVAAEEDFFAESQSNLSKSTFAVFVAKEVEEMGLPLPHSDLAQLSTMHFPSYARTLWRHHRADKRHLGRLLLLILEMYLKEEVADTAFFLSILSEIDRVSLPRTLLLGFECVKLYMDRIGPEMMEIFVQNTSSKVGKLVRSLSHRVLDELKATATRTPSETEAVDVDAFTTTLIRFSVVLQAFSKTSDGQTNLLVFLEGIELLMEHSEQTNLLLTPDMEVMLKNMLHHLPPGQQKLEAYTRVNELIHRNSSVPPQNDIGGLERIDEESIDFESVTSYEDC